MKLFVVYLGGRIKGCHIEIHDVRMVIGNTIEECYPQLKQQWVGDPNSVHIDGYCQLTHVNGFSVTIQNTAPVDQTEHLYFVNVGAYTNNSLAELHEFGFFVAKSKEQAQNQAKKNLLNGFKQLHKDDIYDVDDCFIISLFEPNYYVKLEPSGLHCPLEPIWQGYHKL